VVWERGGDGKCYGDGVGMIRGMWGWGGDEAVGMGWG